VALSRELYFGEDQIITDFRMPKTVIVQTHALESRVSKGKLIIIGAGETARLAYEYFLRDSDLRVYAFSVNRAYIEDNVFCGLPKVALEDLETIYPPDEYLAFVAIGSGHLNRDRASLFAQAKAKGFKCASYVSSRAFIWSDVKIGENCFILENNVVQSGSVIGNNVTLWSGNHVGHLAKISDHCFITSHVVISGCVAVGEYSFIGVNASIADNVCIGKDNLIGLATAITKNTDPDSIYTGNPAVRSAVSSRRFSKVRG
jgi:sugar O-acyltransferase (sialic acid O-acetyltransferase NeuD family)